MTLRPGYALLATSLGFGVVQLDVSVVNVAIKPIGADLGVSTSALQWVVAAYTLAFASLILSAGALGDRIGAKRVYIVGFGLFTIASIACAAAPTIGLLIGARVGQGIGAAILVPCSLTLLHHAYFEPAARARAVGLWAAGASVGVGAGPVVGGLLTTAFGWRAIFLINVPIGLVGVALTLRYATETTRSTERGIDRRGQLAAALTLLALSTALVEGGRVGFSNPSVVAAFICAAVLAVAFVAVEARAAAPMLPLGLFTSRTFASATAIGVMINTAFYGLFFVLSLYFQNVLHFSVLAAGLAFGPTSVAVFIGNVLAGRAANRRRVIAVGAALVALAGAGLLVASTATAFIAIAAQLVALGFGLGLIVPAMTSAVLGSVDVTRSGVASGTLNTARQAGSVIGVALFGSFAAGGVVHGLRLALVVSVILAVLVVALSRGIDGSSSGDDLDDGEDKRCRDEDERNGDAMLEAGGKVPARTRDGREEHRSRRGDPDGRSDALAGLQEPRRGPGLLYRNLGQREGLVR